MKIGIIGGGSIGLLFAFYLSEKYPVCLYVRTKEQLELIQSKGLFLRQLELEKQKFIEVKLYSEWSGCEDLTIIAVKQYHLNRLMDDLYAHSRLDKSILFLQNGMGHIKYLDKLKGEVYVGTVEHGAMRLEPNMVLHTGIGSTKISSIRLSCSRILEMIAVESDKSFSFIIEEDYENMLLKKLVVNAVINPLTAVLGIENGALIENKHYFELVKMIFSEIEQCLQLQNSQPYFENIVTVCKKTAHNQSSMLCDLEGKRPTEVDAILGYILEKSAEREINTPIIATFYQAVKGKECKLERV